MVRSRRMIDAALLDDAMIYVLHLAAIFNDNALLFAPSRAQDVAVRRLVADGRLTPYGDHTYRLTADQMKLALECYHVVTADLEVDDGFAEAFPWVQ